jgi:hypothetical protein
MRIYLPGTIQTLRSLVEIGALGPAPITAFAVTPGLREWYEDEDVDELEYAASVEAARAALRLLAGNPALPSRRVVLAADIADDDVVVRDDLDRGVVRVGSPIPFASIASIHIDEAEAAEVVERAAAAIDAADLGEPEAQDAVDDAEGFELSWFATQEIELLLADPELS